MKKILTLLMIFFTVLVQAQENKPRKANLNLYYTGTVRNVGAGQTYATITAAFNAAATGDIIQIKDGWYDMKNEGSGLGYLLLNDTTKQVLIRGNISNPSAVVLYQDSAVSFCIRLKQTKNLTIQNVTVQTALAIPTVTLTPGSGKNTVVLDNCTISNSSASVIQTVSIFDAPANATYLELKNCTVYQNSNVTSNCFRYQSTWTDATQGTSPVTVLITGGTYHGAIVWLDNPLNFYMYDATLIQDVVNTSYVMAFGSDTNVPTCLSTVLDIRGCYLAWGERTNFTNHVMLIGRGLSNVYFVGNTCYADPTTTSVSIGIVVKAITNTLGNVVVDGNYVVAPRCIYLKGCQNVYVRFNYTRSNWGDNTNGYGLEMYNPNYTDGPISTTGNVVIGNMFIGHAGAMSFATDIGATSVNTTVQTCTFDNNIYRVNGGASFAGNYITSDGVSTSFANRTTYWSKDANSTFSYFQ